MSEIKTKKVEFPVSDYKLEAKTAPIDNGNTLKIKRSTKANRP
jgi:hypothetical protein